MTKITKKDFGKKLAKYSALSLAIAGVADVTGQVNVTDVDPDFVGGMGDSFAIDFDDNGVDDLTVLQSNNGNYELVMANGAGTNSIAEEDAGNPYTYAANIAAGAMIDGTLLFNSFGSMCAGPGYTGSQFCGTGEGFVGVEFDADGETKYGYVRVSVDDASNFTVLDFGYEETAGVGIEAGAENTAGVEDQAFNNFEFFTSNETLTMKAASSMESLVIYNINGQVVLNKALSATTETVDLSAQATGVYIAKVSIDGIEKSFKISK